MLKEKLVYKIKHNVNNQTTYFKTRWVVKKYLKQGEININQTFIIIVKFMAFQALFTIVIFYNLNIKQIDIKIAFLYSIINQLLYMEILCKNK